VALSIIRGDTADPRQSKVDAVNEKTIDDIFDFVNSCLPLTSEPMKRLASRLGLEAEPGSGQYA
jgi:phospholipid N-methyltransferase